MMMVRIDVVSELSIGHGRSQIDIQAVDSVLKTPKGEHQEEEALY